MIQSARKLVALLLIIPASYVAAEGWWRAWMYRGWAAPPRFLHQFWPQPVDGEASYDETFVEMFVVATICSILFYVLSWWLRSRRSDHRTHRGAA